MNRVQAFEVCAALWEDKEFAARLRAHPKVNGELISKYFTDRGIEDGDAMVLVAAYVAGAEHTLLWADRILSRGNPVLREENVRGLVPPWRDGK